MKNESRHMPGRVEAGIKVRENYVPPSLKVFGSVGALTQAGTMGSAEQPMSSNAMAAMA